MLSLCHCSWWTGEWSECSRSCNGGLRTRQVLCKRRISVTEEKVLDDSACSRLRPSLTEPCNNHSCPPEWMALDWSEVGRRCARSQGDLQLNRSECERLLLICFVVNWGCRTLSAGSEGTLTSARGQKECLNHEMHHSAHASIILRARTRRVSPISWEF